MTSSLSACPSMRTMLAENLERLLKGRTEVALSFSGGTDSLCLLFSLVDDLDIRPALYTYCIADTPSEDVRIASVVAGYYGLHHLVVNVLPENLEDDVLRMIGDGIRGKVSIQCMHGHYYVALVVRESVIVNGSGVDGIYGAYARQSVLGYYAEKSEFDLSRQLHLDDPNDDAMEYQTSLYAKHGTEVIYPYRQPNIIGFLMGLSYREINVPHRKAVATRCYPQFRIWKGIYRSRGSQQLVAGVKELHQEVLSSPLNRRGRKSVAWVYKDMAEEMNVGTTKI